MYVYHSNDYMYLVYQTQFVLYENVWKKKNDMCTKIESFDDKDDEIVSFANMNLNKKGMLKRIKGINENKRDVTKHQLILVVNTHRLSHVKSTRMTNHHFTI